MEEIKVTGIVTKAIDYKEKDKLITIFSLELGLITATLKSVNLAKSKLKFASLPFCFAEFVLANKNGFYVVTECYQIESFYDIVSKFEKSVVGYYILETTSLIMQNSSPDERWFLKVITYLKELCYGKANEKILCIKYILEILIKSGYEINTIFCSVCNLNFMGDVFLSYDTGELVCVSCKSANSIKLSSQEFAVLKIVNNTDLFRLGTIKVMPENLDGLLSSLNKNLELRLNKKIKSFIF